MTTQHTILLDIGHANGTGAREYLDHGREEHAQCALIAAELRKRLEAAGHKVVVLDYPEESNSADLRRTAAAAAAHPGAAFGLSLHMDSAATRRVLGTDAESGKTLYRDDANPAPHGAHCCYVSERGKLLAAHIARRLCKLLPGRAEQTVKRPDLYILKHTPQPWALVECGFITNPHDVNTPAADVADAIAAAVADYMEGR